MLTVYKAYRPIAILLSWGLYNGRHQSPAWIKLELTKQKRKAKNAFVFLHATMINDTYELAN